MLCLGAKLPLISDDRQKLVLLNDACNKLFEQLGYSMSHAPGTSMNVENLIDELLCFNLQTPQARFKAAITKELCFGLHSSP